MKRELITGVNLKVMLFCITLGASYLSKSQCDYVEVADERGIVHTFYDGGLGGGVSFADFDQDGWDDLTFATGYGEKVFLFRNTGGSFEKLDLGIFNTCEAKQIMWVDYDNDGDKDLFFTCFGETNKLYRNNGNLMFNDVSEEVGIGSEYGNYFGASWTDFNRDGWLDLYISNYGGLVNKLYQNVDGNSFVDITTESGSNSFIKPSFCSVAFDYNQDGWEDIYIANDRSSKNNLLKNLGNGKFEDASIVSGTDLAMDAMGITVFDLNQDGFFEVYVSNSTAGNALLLNKTDGTFEDIALESGTIFNSIGWGVNAFDFDNDAYTDIYVSGSLEGTNWPSSALYRCVGNESFVAESFVGMESDTLSSFGNATGDIDNDGLLEIAVNNSNGTYSQLWRNECTNGNNWLKISYQGVLTNRDGVGVRTNAFIGNVRNSDYRLSGSSYLSQDKSYAHFGLGAYPVVDSLIIFWPSGIIDRFYDVPANQKFEVVEGQSQQVFNLLGGSSRLFLCSGESAFLTSGLRGRGMTFSWSNGNNTDTLDLIETGDYWLQVESDGQIFHSDTISIDIRETPQVDVIFPDVDVPNAIEVMVSGGTPPYSYYWIEFPGFFESVKENLNSGNYTVEVIDANGCSGFKTFVVETPTGLPQAIEAAWINLSEKSLELSLPESYTGRKCKISLINVAGQTIGSYQSESLEDLNIYFPNVKLNELIIMRIDAEDHSLTRKLLQISK